MQSPTFEWAKSILYSPAWDILSANNPGNAYVFSLPTSCPSIHLPVCSNFELTSSLILEELDRRNLKTLPRDVTPSAPAKRKRVAKPKGQQISEANMTRSERLKKLHKGFKSSTCKDKNCIGCSANPPTISQHVIRDLGKSFCNIDPKDLTDEKLNAKPSKSKATKKKGKSSRDKSADKSDKL